MFTGIIQAVGKIRDVEMHGVDARYVIGTGDLDMSDIRAGDSIACQGVCLTAVGTGDDFYIADVSGETLSRTTFSQLKVNSEVNLEKSVTPNTQLGGHLVSGHIDGTGRVLERFSDGRSERYVIGAPAVLCRYIARKGSIAVDGISLTVNDIKDRQFNLNIVPHTLQVTTIGHVQPGGDVNLEVDIVARYIERLMYADKPAATVGITEAFLKGHGFA